MRKPVARVSRRRVLQMGAAGLAGAALLPRFAAADKGSGSPAKSSPDFTRVEEVFRSQIEKGLVPAAQLAVYVEGECLIELAGGVTRPGGDPVSSGTLFQIRSTTKALTTMVMMQAHERGRFDFDDRVASHWPEFAARGKKDITIRQVLSHRAGIPDGPAIPPEQLGDREAVARAVADMEPVWAPGARNGYHAATIGWVCDEILHRTEGKAMHQLLREDILAPLDIEDLYVGLPREQFDRLAPMVVHPDVRERQETRARFSDFLNTPYGIGLPLSWVGGVATARALGRVFSILAFEGRLEDRRFFRPETQAKMSVPTNAPGEVDARLQVPLRWGMGFLVAGGDSWFATDPGSRALGHAGGSACVGWADPDRRLAVAYLTNHMVRGRDARARQVEIGDAIYAALR